MGLKVTSFPSESNARSVTNRSMSLVEDETNSFAATGFVTHMRPCPPVPGDPYVRFDSTAVFKDNVQSYSTVEPAIDLTASSPLAFARQAAGLR